MEWLNDSWTYLLLGAGFVGLHLLGHRGLHRHGSEQGGSDGDERAGRGGGCCCGGLADCEPQQEGKGARGSEETVSDKQGS